MARDPPCWHCGARSPRGCPGPESLQGTVFHPYWKPFQPSSWWCLLPPSCTVRSLIIMLMCSTFQRDTAVHTPKTVHSTPKEEQKRKVPHIDLGRLESGQDFKNWIWTWFLVTFPEEGGVPVIWTRSPCLPASLPHFLFTDCFPLGALENLMLWLLNS
jgi:hypothetical protein